MDLTTIEFTSLKPSKHLARIMLMPKGKTNTKSWFDGRAFGYLLLVGGVIGVFASFMLTVDKFRVLSDPNFKPECSINPIIACGPVMNSSQGEAFGFPNPFLGLIAFALVANLGALVLSGVQPKRWYWLSFNAGMLFALLFVHWLIHATLYEIGAVCIYCSMVWAVTIPVFWYTTLYNLRMKYLPTPKSLEKLVGFAQRHHFDILILWFLVIIGLVLNRFWYYWSTLL